MPRIKELDYLRGLAALGIMFYHYNKWLYVYEGAQSFLGRISVYGVEIFYILSGITLFHVYHQTLFSEKDGLFNYSMKRFFRIFPLFWLSIILAFFISRQQIPLLKLFLNVTGLFSLFDWENYVAPGSWSIGNELVFYLLFPCFIFLLKRKPIYFILVGIVSLAFFHYFAFYVFNTSDSLHNQWTNYVNPLNHLLMFYVGIAIAILFKKKSNNFGPGSFIILGAVILFAFPSGKDGIHLLYGFNRWVFAFGSILICIGFYQSEMRLPDMLHQPLKKLGEISYGVYLLHPFVYQIVCIIIRKLLQWGIHVPQSNGMLITTAALLTLLFSNFVYHNFEVYFIRKGASLQTNFYKS
jgi:peptidoglycan/LPS O-acetylase OafA/YrhL